MKLTIETANDLPKELYDAIVAHLVKHNGKLTEYPDNAQTAVFELRDGVAYASVHSDGLTISFPPMQLAQPEQPAAEPQKSEWVPPPVCGPIKPSNAETVGMIRQTMKAAEPQAKVPMLEWTDHTMSGVANAKYGKYSFSAYRNAFHASITDDETGKDLWISKSDGNILAQIAEMQAVFEAHYDEFVAGTFGMPKEEQPPYPLDDPDTWPNGTKCDYIPPDARRCTVVREEGAKCGVNGFFIDDEGLSWEGSEKSEIYNIRFPEQPDKVWKPWARKEVAGE